MNAQSAAAGPGDVEKPGGDAEAAAVAAEEGGLQLSKALEVAIVLTVLSLVPAILISLTSFTRIIIVLSFVRRSLAVQELPPNPILIGLSLFLTTFVMAPVFQDVYDESYAPYRDGRLTAVQAADAAWGSVRGFLLDNTREDELGLFEDLAGLEAPEEGPALSREDLPIRVVVPAFVLSELKTAFQMGFLLFLPFLVIDLVIASVLISMGMFMLPPVMISTPIKLLLFVLVDGWRLVCESLVTSFVT
ncbi:MAG TPA: flagellar biosynthesis protein FliP [Planctomycetes bacterium]|nr:flagellar biosynthesis protein FliP [Planctomycetota bacterium]